MCGCGGGVELECVDVVGVWSSSVWMWWECVCVELKCVWVWEVVVGVCIDGGVVGDCIL